MARRGSTSKTLVWILMALLILGLGGFGVTNLGGNVRSVGSVGDQQIDINDYARALREDIRAIESQTGQALDFTQAQELGVDRMALGRLVAASAMDNETDAIGLSIGDESLGRQVAEIRAFTGPDGRFNRDAYRMALEQSGLSEAEFEADMRRETARTLFQGAMVSGVDLPQTYVDTLIDYIGERRSFSYVRLTQDDLAEPLPQPDDATLEAHYQANLPQFTLPQMKRISYVWLAPEMILDSIEIDEEALAAQYEERKDEFQQPERRLVERLAFSDEAAAEQAKSAIEAGETSFEDLVQERGLRLADLDLGDVTRSELEDAGAAVFSADTGQVVGPFASPVGPALFRVNGVLPAQNRPLEEVRDSLRGELAADRARRVIEGQIDVISDLLAGGATLEDVAKETDMELDRLDWHADVGADINGYPAFRDAARTVTAEDYPEVIQTEDGGIFALRLDEVLEPRVQPFEDVRDEVRIAWESSETESRLRAQAEAAMARLAEGATAEALGLTWNQENDVTRDGFVEGMPSDFMETVFAMQPGDMQVISSFGSAILLRLDAISPPDADDTDIAQTRDLLEGQAQNALAQDLYVVLADALRARAGVKIDQTALNAVHANFR